MLPSVSIVTHVVPQNNEKCIKMDIIVFDQERLRRIGNVGESFACDIQVQFDPIGQVRSTPSDLNRTQCINDSLTWTGGMRLHKIGANKLKVTEIVPFDSDTFKDDSIGTHLTGKAVSESINRVRANMESYYSTRGNLNHTKKYPV